MKTKVFIFVLLLNIITMRLFAQGLIEENATLVEVIDGDTIKVIFDNDASQTEDRNTNYRD